MPFQSEKQRRYLHANHPEIAKRWEKEYSNGGILDITGDEQITTDEGNDISLVDESETGVSTLFRAKNGGNATKNIKGQPHMLAYITPNEEDKLVALGGQETMTDEGIPAYPEWDNYGQTKSEFEGSSPSSVNDGGNARENQIQRNAMPSSHTTAPRTLSDPEEKKDYFTQSYVGPSIFGGTGYRDTVVPNTTQYGNKSRLGSLLMGGIGALAGIPGLSLLTHLQNLGPFNNKAFYDQKVVPAGKTNLSYDDYMAARMAGTIDAYGNPINTTGGEDRSGIKSIDDYDMFDDVDGNIEDENITVANVPFESRFLQNQPEDVKKAIEARMQNYYTV